MISLKKLIFLSVKLLNGIILSAALLKIYNLRISLVEFIPSKKRKNKNGSELLKIVKKLH